MSGERRKEKRRVAVVGTGISGLASAWSSAREGFDVTVFEANDRLGGHSFTYPGEGDRPPVDLGFQVFNFTTYPYLCKMFEELGVVHEPSDMSFALSVDEGRVEWASHGLDTILAQPSNMWDPSFLYMMREVVRFQGSTEVLHDDRFANMTLGEYLDLRGYSKRFRDDYLLPTTAAVWSVPNGQMLEFPVVPLIAFMDNHHLLSPLGDRPRWRIVSGRSERYVQAVEKSLKEKGARIHLSSPVTKVEKLSDEKVRVSFRQKGSSNDSSEEFEHVVMACHSNTTASLLQGDNLEADRALVGKIRYQSNRVLLHSDESQMPRVRKAWSSWNVLDKSADASDRKSKDRDICVTYWLNHLQNLPKSAPLLLCTLNPITEPDRDKVVFETVLDHPVFDREGMKAQKQINEIQANACSTSRNVWFAGAWLGSGFHEDGIRSALAVCTSLASEDGKTPPDWAREVGAPENPNLKLIRGPSPSISWRHRGWLRIFQSVASRGITKGFMHLMLPNGNDLHFGRASKEDSISRGEPTVAMRIQDLGMLAKCVAESDIGLGEAYMHRMFELDDLTALFDLLIVNNESLRETLNPLGLYANLNATILIGALMYCAGNVVEHLRHMMRDNTVVGSRKNIEEHYDLGNAMYKHFLDETMTYSCGLHRKEYGAVNVNPGEELPLYEAQLEKLDSIVRKADIKSTDHVLEIGCGWGSFAIRAASTTGCRVTGITISTEQLAEARKRVKQAGLDDRVNLIICDYRKMGIPKVEFGEEVFAHDLAPGCFDKIVSIEMLEAVGHDHLPEYFETVHRMLKPHGRAVIQVISIADERYKEYCATSDFIRKHIFPGGHLPCEAAIRWASDDTDLFLSQIDDIGPDYAITLRMWRERFLANKDAIMALGYPESWFRCFEMYFAYCESGFAQKYILNYHLTFDKDAEKKNISRQEALKKSRQQVYEKFMVPAILSFMVWVCTMALTLNGVVRQLTSICCIASLFSIFVTAMMPPVSQDTLEATKRSKRHFIMVTVKLGISSVVCVVVVGLLAFHEVLYTTQVANRAPKLYVAPTRDTEDGQEAGIRFCHWNVDSAACDLSPLSSNTYLDETGEMFVIRSPMHFVIGCLAFASVSRFLMEKKFMNFLHAAALIFLSFLSYSGDARTAATALGLAIVHGVSELHAAISALRQVCKLIGLSWGDQLYRKLWTIDVSSLLFIRWLPVPILLTPVILRAPWMVFISICMIAVRETSVLLETLFELKEDYENRVNTEELLKEARSKEELIGALIGSKNDASSSK